MRQRLFLREAVLGAHACLGRVDLSHEAGPVALASPVRWFDSHRDSPEVRAPDHAPQRAPKNPLGAKRRSQLRAPVATQQTKRPPEQRLRTRPAMPVAFANWFF